jgi:hypothetical protein
VTEHLRETVQKEERLILAHSIRGFSPWSAGSVAFRPVTRQKYHGGRAKQKKTAHLVAARKQRERVIQGLSTE